MVRVSLARKRSNFSFNRKYLCSYLVIKNIILQVKSNHAEYKHVSLRIVVIPGKDEIFEVSIKGRTDTTPIKSDFNIICNMWLVMSFPVITLCFYTLLMTRRS